MHQVTINIITIRNLMRNILSLLFLFPLMVNAQNVPDSVKVDDAPSEQNESLDNLTALEKKKEETVNSYKMLKQQYNSLLLKLQADSVTLSKMRMDSSALQEENEEYKKKLYNADKVLVSTASNSLYLPYEAYTVEKIAIRAFETINDDKLRQKHELQYRMLKNYQSDIRNILSYLQQAKEKLSNPFELKGTGAASLLQNFKQETFYVTYSEYSDWAQTYLGKIILRIENQLKNNKANFDDIIKELEKCLKTVDDL